MDLATALMWWGLGFVAGFAIASFLVFYVKATSSIWPWLNKFGSTKPKVEKPKKCKTEVELEQEVWDKKYKKKGGSFLAAFKENEE